MIAAQAILFKIVLSYPTADFHFMNFLMNLDLYGNGCIKVFRDSIFRLRGISDKFVFLDGFDPEEMVSSFVFAETFPFPLCPSDEEGIKIAQNVMFKRCLVEKQCLNNTGVMKIMFSVATTIGWSLVCLGKRQIITPDQ